MSDRSRKYRYLRRIFFLHDQLREAKLLSQSLATCRFSHPITTDAVIMKHRIILCVLLVATLATEVTGQNRTHRRRGIILGGLAGAALGIAIGDKGNNETAGALIGAAAGAIAGGAIGNQKDQRAEQDMRYRSGIYGATPSTYPTHPEMRRSQYPLGPQTSQETQTENGRRFMPRRRTLEANALPAYNKPYIYPQGRSYLANPHANANVPDYHRQAPRQVVIESPSRSGPLTLGDVMNMTRSGVSQTLIIRQIDSHGMRTRLTVADIISLHEAGISADIIEAMQINSLQQITVSGQVIKDQPGSTPTTAIESILPPPPLPTR